MPCRRRWKRCGGTGGQRRCGVEGRRRPAEDFAGDRSIGVCEDCRRTVRLRGRARICSNCSSIRNSACGGCGEHRRSPDALQKQPDAVVPRRTLRGGAGTDADRRLPDLYHRHRRVRPVLSGQGDPYRPRRHGHQPAIAAAPRRPPGLTPTLKTRTDQRAADPAHRRLALINAGAANDHHHIRSCSARTPPTRSGRTEGRHPVRGLLGPDPQTGTARCAGATRPVAARDPQDAVCEPCLKQARRRRAAPAARPGERASPADFADKQGGRSVIDAIGQARRPPAARRAGLPARLPADRRRGPARRGHPPQRLRLHGADLPAALCASVRPAADLFLYDGMPICRTTGCHRDRGGPSATPNCAAIIDAVIAADLLYDAVLRRRPTSRRRTLHSATGATSAPAADRAGRPATPSPTARTSCRRVTSIRSRRPGLATSAASTCRAAPTLAGGLCTSCSPT